MFGILENKEKSLQDEIILLSNIPDKWRLVNHLFEEKVDKLDEGPIHALYATCLALKDLWYLHGIKSAEDPEWATIRELMMLGLIKDTKKHGNTSVSMGAAKLKFLEHPNTKYIAFLNCGTGGIKYQLYSSKGYQHLKKEFKPKSGASPNALEAGLFKPKEPVTFEATKELFVNELAHNDLPWKDKEGVIVYAFVTGTIREYWENADEKEKLLMEEKMKELFEPHGIKPQGTSYFMPQDEEGTLELLGAQQMYANLVADKQLDQGTKVVGSLGIGKGSCQWMIQETDGTMTLVGHKAGMTNLPKLVELTNTLTTAYSDPVKWKKFKKSMHDAGKALIALKSGAALLIDNKNFAHVKKELVTREEYPTRAVRITLGGTEGKSVPHSWTGSLDRLCAEAQVLFRRRDLEMIWREDGQGFQVVPRNGTVKENELLYFTPRGVLPVKLPESPRPPDLVKPLKVRPQGDFVTNHSYLCSIM